MRYNKIVAVTFFKSQGLPMPLLEYQFAREQGRRWRFDFAFVTEGAKVYLEVQGGTFGIGKPCPCCKQRKQLGHNRGGYIRKEHEKRNAATLLGWRGLWVEPRDLCLVETANLIKGALGLSAGARNQNYEH